ncbi:MAG: hypothetical protein IJ722_00610 [Alloprevotella sp.]|nr:hypothetical protein [Alloprevotella sp.]
MKTKRLLVSVLALLLLGCSHGPLGSLVGADRDEHGCLGSAGYVWSGALHQCVRLWEAAERIESGKKAVYLLFSIDSTYAEVFTPDSAVLCRRDKGASATWRARKSPECVTVTDGMVMVRACDTTFTKLVR